MIGSRTASGRKLLSDIALTHAESDYEYGNFAAAEISYLCAVRYLTERLGDGPADPDERLDMLKRAQFGLAAAQLCRRDFQKAKESAIAALADSFLDQEEVRDSRRYILVCLAAAKTRQDFANAWSHMLEL